MSERISVKQLITDFNRSPLRRALVPDNLYSGWPCLVKRGKCLCITIPYYSRVNQEKGIALFPLYCSVTIAVRNPKKVFDFTIYPYHKDWKEMDYSKPCGTFKHKALENVKTREEYQSLCDQLYACYDDMLECIQNNAAFEGADEMRRLFALLMEPSHYPQYLKIGPKFYANVCQL